MTVAIIGCGLCAMLCGCSGKSKSSGNSSLYDDRLDPTEIEYTLSDRFEDRPAITDVSFEMVRFGYDNYQIAAEEVYKIEAVTDYMQSNPSVLLIAEGHCDERGSREYNLSLGEHRADAVRAWLISLGIDGDRIQTRTYGEEQALDPGPGEAAWKMNRRAEFALFR